MGRYTLQVCYAVTPIPQRLTTWRYAISPQDRRGSIFTSVHFLSSRAARDCGRIYDVTSRMHRRRDVTFICGRTSGGFRRYFKLSERELGRAARSSNHNRHFPRNIPHILYEVIAICLQFMQFRDRRYRVSIKKKPAQTPRDFCHCAGCIEDLINANYY